MVGTSRHKKMRIALTSITRYVLLTKHPSPVGYYNASPVALQELEACFTLMAQFLFLYSFETGCYMAEAGYELLILLYGITGKPHFTQFEFISCSGYGKLVTLIFTCSS